MPEANAGTPAPGLIAALRAELQRFAPFSQMSAEQVEAFVAAARQTYYAPGETVLDPADGVVSRLLFVRRGHVEGGRSADAAGASFHLDPGDLFPVAAWLAHRPVSNVYRAVDDCFCFEVPDAALRDLLQRSPVMADFLNARVRQFLALSQQALKSAYAAQALAEQSMETRLGQLPRRALVSCEAATPLREALMSMQRQRVGSILVLDEHGGAAGILTRHDLLDRVALPQPPMNTPIAALMSHPVHTLDVQRTLQDAVLLMARHGVLHVPVTEQGRVVNIVSERDLFALQQLSLSRLSDTLRRAPDRAALVAAAPDIRRLARALLGQGLSARSLTELISHLNDLLAERAVRLVAEAHGLDLHRACWLAFGSEGRGEQTISTDQDNGLVFADDDGPLEPQRAAWRALGRDVNQLLDECGYPLCQGRIMAGEDACCLTAEEWAQRFDQWIDHGAPQDLLSASIFFDMRALAGELALADPLRQRIRQRAAATPRFLRQMAENALRNSPKLNWLGAFDTRSEGEREWIDLKLNGAMIFVDAARLYALAHGVEATGTRARLEVAAAPMRLEARECETWIGAFEFVQSLRLRVQMDAAASATGAAANRLYLDTLNDIDRRILKESFRAAQQVQQRMALDYLR